MSNKSKTVLILTFLTAAAYFAVLQWSPTFADPDSFYHTKMAVLMRENLIIKSFPWLKFAPFTENFTDQHFLYHIFLIPFIIVFSPLLGVKIAAVIFAALAVVSFFLLLKQFRIRYPLFYTLILLLTPPFIFRLNLAKTSSLSLITLFWTIILIWQRRYYALFFLSFLYVWLYGGWSLLLILIGCSITADLLSSKIKKIDWKIILSALSGLSLGLVSNPFFPHNLKFYWEQTVSIGLINYQYLISVGQEWYPYKITDFLAGNIFGIISALIAFGLFFKKIYFKKTTIHENDIIIKRFQKIFTLYIFSGLLGVMTLKSQRFVEYFAPFFILANAFFLDSLLPGSFSLKNYFHKILNLRKKYNLIILSHTSLVLIIFFLVTSWKIHINLTRQFDWNYLQKASAWLKANTPDHSLIFHSSWGDFPFLFYHNNHNIYIAGLDPTFFYRFNPHLHQEWNEITNAKIKNGLAKKIKNDFGALFMFVKPEEKSLLEIVDNDHDFIKRYEDQESKIFEIR